MRKLMVGAALGVLVLGAPASALAQAPVGAASAPAAAPDAPTGSGVPGQTAANQTRPGILPPSAASPSVGPYAPQSSFTTSITFVDANNTPFASGPDSPR